VRSPLRRFSAHITRFMTANAPRQQWELAANLTAGVLQLAGLSLRNLGPSYPG